LRVALVVVVVVVVVVRAVLAFVVVPVVVAFGRVVSHAPRHVCCVRRAAAVERTVYGTRSDTISDRSQKTAAIRNWPNSISRSKQ